MSLMLAILGWLLAAGLLVVAAALILPLHLEMRATADERVNVSFALRPFGRFGPRIPLKRSEPKDKKEKKKAVPKKKSRKRRGFRAEPRRFGAAALRFVADIVRLIRVRVLSLDLRFGCDDPSETGEIYGLMTPLIYGTYGWPKSDIRVEPVFDRVLLKGHAAVSLSLVPARLVPAFVRFGWTAFGPRR